MSHQQSWAAHQTVFKIDLNNDAGARVDTQRAFVSRKSHRKSRGGCSSCKRKRIKCDEKRPRCTKCTKAQVECVYTVQATLESEGSSTSTSSPSVTSEMHSMAVDLVDTELDMLLLSSSGSLANGNARLLHHFQNVVSLTIGCTTGQEIMYKTAASDAWCHPALMHMILAISCVHQRSMGVTQSSELALAEATHWERGLQLHRQYFANAQPGKSVVTWDAVVTATFLQIALTYSLDEDVPLDAYQSTGEDLSRALEPLAVTGGFRSIFYVFGENDANSNWFRYLTSTDDESGTFSRAIPGINGLPRALVELCDLKNDSNEANHPYHRIVRLLTPVLQLEPSNENFPTLLAFPGRTWPDFKPLVTKRDPRGLLLAAYWFAALRQVDQWWLHRRAKTECRAIVAYLSTLNDPCIDALLPFPAAFEDVDAGHMWRYLGKVMDDCVGSPA